MIEYITSNWILLLLEAFAGLLYYLFNELEDECIRNTWDNHKQFLNTNLSWRNKWAEGSTTIPRFWGSTTFFVFVTDGEHLFQWLKNIFILLGIGLISWQFMLAFLGGRLVMSFLKEMFFEKIK
jgi:hypothetical protein